jgi:hypothetical protein
VEGLRLRGHGVGAQPQEAPQSVAERSRQPVELLALQLVDHRQEVVAEQHLAGEAGVGQRHVVQVVGEPDQERHDRVGADERGDEHAVHRDGEAVVAVRLGGLDDQPRPARCGGAGTGAAR